MAKNSVIDAKANASSATARIMGSSRTISEHGSLIVLGSIRQATHREPNRLVKKSLKPHFLKILDPAIQRIKPNGSSAKIAPLRSLTFSKGGAARLGNWKRATVSFLVTEFFVGFSLCDDNHGGRRLCESSRSHSLPGLLL
jgi:hypothetical protein